MTVIEAMKNYLLTCPYLTARADELRIDYPGAKPVSFALASNGTNTVQCFITGGRVIEHNFVLYAKQYTIENAYRLENSGFFEDFADWLHAQTLAQVFPTCCDAEFQKITSSNGMLFDLDESGVSGTYMIQIQAIYEKG